MDGMAGSTQHDEAFRVFLCRTYEIEAISERFLCEFYPPHFSAWYWFPV
jgi:hypothetical protein